MSSLVLKVMDKLKKRLYLATYKFFLFTFQIQLKALQTLESVFQCRERSVACPFINALAPHIVMVLNDMCINKPTREDQLTVTLAAIKIMENLVERTEDHLSMYYQSHSPRI